MYITPGTTPEQIKKMIAQIEWELEHEVLTDDDREFLHDELAYLESFIPQETW